MEVQLQPIPLTIELDERKVRLGEQLFHDPQLSHNNTLSCASCHNLETGGADRLFRSVDGRLETMSKNHSAEPRKLLRLVLARLSNKIKSSNPAKNNPSASL